MTGIPSILKNFLEHERITMHMNLSMANVDKLKTMSILQPSNLTQKSLDHSLRHIFVDNDPSSGEDPTTPPIIYEIASSGIMELNGPQLWRHFSTSEFNSLLHTAITNVDKEDTLLSLLRDRYRVLLRSRPRAYHSNMAGYIAHEFNDCMEELIEHRVDDETFMEDVTELQELINIFLDEDRYSIA